MYAQLPRLEILVYFILWIGGVFYSIYHVYLASNMFGRQFGVEDLAPGWQWTGRQKDVADYEWLKWLPFLWQLAPWLALHHVVAEVLRWMRSQIVLQLWYVLVTVLFVFKFAGSTAVLALLLQPCLLLFMFCLGGCWAVWGASLPIIIGLNYYQNEEWTEQQLYILSVCVSWLHLRTISFCLDENSEESSRFVKGNGPQILRLLSFSLYLPLMFLGPLVLYHEFQAGLCGERQSLQERLIQFGLQLCRFLGWVIFTEWALHYIYCNAIQLQYEALPFLDAWTLNGLAYCIGQFFHMKYVVIYGLMGNMARFDGIAAPATPRCISHVSCYSDMWRYFDRGFYCFLVRYVYLPLVGDSNQTKSSTLPSKVGGIKRLCSSALCFAFVYVWHGLSQCILVWAVCNFLGITVEAAGRRISTLHIYKDWESKLSAENVRRWRALVTSPLFIMSALTAFYFFGGMEVGNVFVLQVWKGSLKRVCSLLFFSYCMCQVSMEVKRWIAVKKTN